MFIEPKLTFRIIRRCNFSCPRCSTFSKLNRKGIMKLSDFRKGIDILETSNFSGTLNISGGEPTLHRELPSMIRYASAKLSAAHIVVFTNGDWVGRRGWRQRLKRFAGGPNVLIRFSLDHQHVQGAILALRKPLNAHHIKSIEHERMDKAKCFRDACHAGGICFDFAYKGSMVNARRYMRELGDVPVYLIRFRKDPDIRPKKKGFFAVDVQENNSVLVYPTLGHIPAGEPLGGIETLSRALKINKKKIQ
jgi:hypothetical protein